MELFLNEIESINALGSIRVEPYAKCKNFTNKNSDSFEIGTNIEIIPFHKVWNQVHASFNFNNSELNDDINIQNYMDYVSDFSIYLTNDYNQDKLILADTNLQDFSDSNILEFVSFLIDQVWIPIINGDLTLSDTEWEDIIPDIFQLADEDNISLDSKLLAYDLFDIVLDSPDYAEDLHTHFFNGEQPIIIPVSEFLEFCNENNITLTNN